MKILFVCLGNICRSPAAEAIFKKKILERGKNELFFVDSAGLHGYHSGEEADSRMINHAARRGYDITSISRKITGQDIEDFDLIVGMDNSNIEALNNMAYGKDKRGKISKITGYVPDSFFDEVPDPYYGGDRGFENVLDIIEESVDALINKILEG